MTDPKPDPETPGRTDDPDLADGDAAGIDLPLEEGDFDSQPG